MKEHDAFELAKEIVEVALEKGMGIGDILRIVNKIKKMKDSNKY